MMKPDETVLDYVVREIKSHMAFKPIIYLETDDHMLLSQLLNRRDCFTVLKKDDDGGVTPASYTRDDTSLNVVDTVSKPTGAASLSPERDKDIGKILGCWKNRPLYFTADCFNVLSPSSQRKLIREYIHLVYEKHMDTPLRQNLIIVSPVGIRVGDDIDDSVPNGYEQFIYTVDVPLPGAMDIVSEVVRVRNETLCRFGYAPLTEEQYMTAPDAYIDGFRGLRRSQIVYVLQELQDALGVVTTVGLPSTAGNVPQDELNRVAGQLIEEQKHQIVAQNGDIEYIETDDAVEPGGVEGVAEWIGRKKLILDDPRRARSYAMRFPKGILMAGLPGSGKSLTAKFIAKKLDLPLIQFKMDMVLQGLVGSSEQRLRQVLKLFEASAPCVIWIDEIEKEFAGMNGSGEGDSGVNKRCLAKLLNWMQENKERCFIYATANRTANLPQELLRRGRFDRLYYTFLPLKEQCVNIIWNQIRRIKSEAPELFDASVDEDAVRRMSDVLLAEMTAYENRFFTGSDLEGLLADVKEQMFLDRSRDVSGGNPYNADELREHLLRVARRTITYAEGNFNEVIDYWIGLKYHRFYNAAVVDAVDIDSADPDAKYRYMLFDFSDLQDDGSGFKWREGLRCRSDHPYDLEMFERLTKGIENRMAQIRKQAE